MSAPTQGEAIVLVSSMLGLDPENASGAVLILALKDGQVGICATGECECSTLQVIGRAIERISEGLHKGEKP